MSEWDLETERELEAYIAAVAAVLAEEGRDPEGVAALCDQLRVRALELAMTHSPSGAVSSGAMRAALGQLETPESFRGASPAESGSAPSETSATHDVAPAGFWVTAFVLACLAPLPLAGAFLFSSSFAVQELGASAYLLALLLALLFGWMGRATRAGQVAMRLVTAVFMLTILVVIFISALGVD